MTIRVNVYRKDLLTTTGSRTDGGALAVTTQVQSLLALQPEGGQARTMLASCLEAVFPDVAQVSESVGYKWVWCEDIGRYKFICCDASTLEIDDGGVSPVVVEIEVGTQPE